MAKFEEVWEYGRLVIRRVAKDEPEGTGGRGKKAGRGLVERALESLRAAVVPARSAPGVDQMVRIDGRTMEKALRELAWQRDGLRGQKAASLAGGLDPVLQATLFKRG